MEPKAMTFGDALVTLMNKYSITNTLLAKKVDISPRTVTRWRQNEKLPSKENRLKLAEMFRVDVSQLELAIIKEASSSTAIEQLRNMIKNTEAKPPSDEWLGKGNFDAGLRVKRIPGGDEIAAGHGPIQDSLGFDPDDDRNFLPGELWPFDPYAFWIRVTGHSMHPDYAPGDAVIGSPMLQDQLENGDTVCVRFTPEGRFKGGRMLKILNKLDDDHWELKSLNPMVLPIPVNPVEIEWMGPVVVQIKFPGKSAGWDLTGVPMRPREHRVLPKTEFSPQEFPDYEGPQ